MYCQHCGHELEEYEEQPLISLFSLPLPLPLLDEAVKLTSKPAAKLLTTWKRTKPRKKRKR